MKKFLCLALAGLSIAGGLCAHPSEEEWNRGYELAFELDQDRWSQDQRNGYQHGASDFLLRKKEEMWEEGKKRIERELKEYKAKKEERRKEWNLEK